MENESRYICYIGLGANLGNRQEQLQAALRRLADEPEIELGSVSSFYETEPWGKTDQPAFLNAAAVLYTSLQPEALLAVCQRIEQELGRVRHEHWGPRTIDIDLLYIPGVTMHTPVLTLPHPYLLQRLFVLEPLAEIAGDVDFEGQSFAAHCARLREEDEAANENIR